jgi:hypothetical protein
MKNIITNNAYAVNVVVRLSVSRVLPLQLAVNEPKAFTAVIKTAKKLKLLLLIGNIFEGDRLREAVGIKQRRGTPFAA